MRQIISPLDGFRSPFGALRGGFSPSALFALAEPGVWYDPSDLTTLFTDTAGTTPVTTPGQSVALALDKSKGLVLGSELVTNGDFSAGSTGWTIGTGWSIGSGVASSNNASGFNALQQTILTSGRSYKVTFTVSGYVSGLCLISLGSNIAFQVAANGTYTVIGLANSQFFYVYAWGGGVFNIDNISVKELPGFHATQATTASRPIYGIVPVGGRRNLLTFTEQFDNAAWSKANMTVTTNADTAPDGTISADLVTATIANGTLSQIYSATSANTITWTSSIYVKRKTGTGQVQFLHPGGGVPLDITSSLSTTAYTRFTISGTGYSTYALNRLQLSVVGDEVYVWGAQLETGSTATAYQRVVSQYDVTEAGVASVSYLAFDTSKFLVTPTITPGIDKAQVFAGVRKNSDAAAGAIIETSSAFFANNGSFGLFAAGSTSPTGFEITSRGTANALAGATSAAPITNILTGLGDISGDRATLRINGTQAAQVTTDQGTGNYLAYQLYIGMRAGSSLPFNGQLYSLVVRFGANLDATTISNTETWVAGRTGISI